MSFFKKLTKEFDELKAKFTDDDDKPKTETKTEDKSKLESSRGESDSYYGNSSAPPSAPSPQQQHNKGGPPPADGHSQQSYSAPPGSTNVGYNQGYGSHPPPPGQQYGQGPSDQGHNRGAPPPPGHLYGQGPPQSQQYGHHPPQGQQWGQPAPGQGYPGQAPQHSSPEAPPCTPGWSAQWDHSSQRWYYTEHASGRTQWEQPNAGAVGRYGNASHGSAPHYDGPAGHDAIREAGGSGYPPYGQVYGHDASHGQVPYGSDTKEVKGDGKEKKSGSNAMLYGAGGLAAGVVGGALLADALDDSDDEKHHSAAAAPAAAAQPQYYSDPSYSQSYVQPQGYNDPSYGQQPYGAPPADTGPPAGLPATGADGDSVSSSDREEVQEARKDYEEALANASEGSSSDQEEIEEARQEYEEAYEETFED